MMISKSKKLLLIVSVLIILISVFSCSPKSPETLPPETTQTLSAGTNTKEAEPIETANRTETTVLPATTAEQTDEKQTGISEQEKEKTPYEIEQEEREKAIIALNRPMTHGGVYKSILDDFFNEMLESYTYIGVLLDDHDKQINEFTEVCEKEFEGMTLDQILESHCATYTGIRYFNITKENFSKEWTPQYPSDSPLYLSQEIVDALYNDNWLEAKEALALPETIYFDGTIYRYKDLNKELLTELLNKGLDKAKAHKYFEYMEKFLAIYFPDVLENTRESLNIMLDMTK
ncbi:MAG: hypothetical protein VB118_05290 [Oscillospiraceae bacterium]|nr:hypothetical protein [Oscillospiraceae bacterium]